MLEHKMKERDKSYGFRLHQKKKTRDMTNRIGVIYAKTKHEDDKGKKAT